MGKMTKEELESHYGSSNSSSNTSNNAYSQNNSNSSSGKMSAEELEKHYGFATESKSNTSGRDNGSYARTSYFEGRNTTKQTGDRTVHAGASSFKTSAVQKDTHTANWNARQTAQKAEDPKGYALKTTEQGYKTAKAQYALAQQEYNTASANALQSNSVESAQKLIDAENKLKLSREKLAEARKAYEDAGGDVRGAFGNTVLGGLQGSWAGLSNAFASSREGAARAAKTQLTTELSAMQSQLENAEKNLAAAMAKYGDANDPNVMAAQRAVDELKNNIELYSGMAENQGLERFASAAYKYADTQTARSQEKLEEAKLGKGKLGSFLVDAGAAGIQMGADLALGAVTGTGMLPMLARSYGGAAQEARQEGASYEKQFAAGVLTAAVEAATEKLAGGGIATKVFGKGGLDAFVEKAIGTVTEKPAVMTALRLLYNALGEGAEEAISDILQPAIKTIYNGKSMGQNYSELEASEILYDALVGAALGFVASGATLVNGQNKAANAELLNRNSANNATAQNSSQATQNAVQPVGGDITLPEAQNAEKAPSDVLNSKGEAQQTATGTKQGNFLLELTDALEKVGIRMDETGNYIVNGKPMSPELYAKLNELARRGDASAETIARVIERNSANINMTPAELEAEVYAEESRARDEVKSEPVKPMSNSEAERIINDPEAKAEFERRYGVKIEGTKAEQRRIVKNAVNQTVQNTETAAETVQNTETAQSEQAEQQAPQTVTEETAPQETQPQTPKETPTEAQEAPTGTAEKAREGKAPDNGRTVTLADDEVVAKAKNVGSDTYTAERQGKNRERVSDVPKTAMKADAIPQEVKDVIGDKISEQVFTYKMDSNAEQLERARQRQDAYGWSKCVQDFIRDVEAGRSSSDMTAMGALIFNNISNSSLATTDEAMDFLGHYYDYLNRVGSSLQAAKILKSMTPEGRLYQAEKQAKRATAKLTDKQKKKRAKGTEKADAKSVTEAVNEAKQTATEQTAKVIEGKRSGKAKSKAKADENIRTEEVAAKEEWTPFDFGKAAGEEVAKSIKARIKRTLDPKPKNALDTFVSYVKRFANEKIKLGDNAKPMTPTELLAEVVANEDLVYEAYEEAKAAFNDENSTGYREFVTDFLDTPIGIDGTYNPDNKVFTRAIVESAVATNENKEMIRRQSALGTSREAIAKTIATDLIAKTKAKGDMADTIRQASSAYVQDVLATDKKSGEARVSAIVKSMMKDVGLTFRQLAIESNATKEGIQSEIANMLTMQYAVDPASAEKIAESVANEYDAQLENAINRELEKRFAPKDKTKTQLKPLAEKLTEAVNLGAFNSQYASEAANKIFGLTQNIELDPKLVEAFMNAETNADKEAALKAIQHDLEIKTPSTAIEKLNEVRRIGMLLNPRTLTKNITANMPMWFMRKGAEAISSGMQKAFIRDTSKRTRGFASLEQRSIAGEYYKKNASGLVKADKWNVDRTKTIFKGTGLKGTKIADRLSKMTDSEIQNFGEALRQVTYWSMEKGDSPFVRSAFVDSLSEYMAAQNINSMQGITQDAIDFATANAMEATFKNSNIIADGINSIKRNGGVAGQITDVLMPFTTTPTNLAILFGKYSPIGFIDAGVSAAKGNDAATTIDKLAKSTVGSAIILLGFGLRRAGWITGAEDDDEKKAAFDKANGIQKYSVNFPWATVDYSWAEPSGSLLALGAELADFTNGGESAESVLWNATFNALDAIAYTSCFQNVIDVLKGTGSPTEKVMKAVVEGYATQIIPSFVGAIANVLDDTVRSTYTGKGELSKLVTIGERKIPGLSQTLPASVNVKGEEVKRADTWYKRAWDAFIRSGQVSYGEKTAFDDYLYDMIDRTGETTFLPYLADYSFVKSGTTYRLDGKQYETYQKTCGTAYYSIGTKWLESEAFKNLSEKQQMEALINLRGYSHYLATKQYFESTGMEIKVSDQERKYEIASGLENPGAYLIGYATISDLSDYYSELRAAGAEDVPSMGGLEELSIYIDSGIGTKDADALSSRLLSKTSKPVYDYYRDKGLSPAKAIEAYNSVDTNGGGISQTEVVTSNLDEKDKRELYDFLYTVNGWKTSYEEAAKKNSKKTKAESNTTATAGGKGTLADFYAQISK